MVGQPAGDASRLDAERLVGPFRAEVEANVPRLPADDPAMYQGGQFVKLAPTRRPDSWLLLS